MCQEVRIMKCDLCGGTVTDREVFYTIEFKERLHIIEHVPVKECLLLHFQESL